MKKLKSLLSIVTMNFVIIGCGGGGGSSNPSNNNENTEISPITVKIIDVFKPQSNKANASITYDENNNRVNEQINYNYTERNISHNDIYRPNAGNYFNQNLSHDWQYNSHYTYDFKNKKAIEDWQDNEGHKGNNEYVFTSEGTVTDITSTIFYAPDTTSQINATYTYNNGKIETVEYHDFETNIIGTKTFNTQQQLIADTANFTQYNTSTDVTYEYDANGNLIKIKHHTMDYTVGDTVGEYTFVGSGNLFTTMWSGRFAPFSFEYVGNINGNISHVIEKTTRTDGTLDEIEKTFSDGKLITDYIKTTNTDGSIYINEKTYKNDILFSTFDKNVYVVPSTSSTEVTQYFYTNGIVKQDIDYRVDDMGNWTKCITNFDTSGTETDQTCTSG